jgi:hypothetical protein
LTCQALWGSHKTPSSLRRIWPLLQNPASLKLHPSPAETTTLSVSSTASALLWQQLPAPSLPPTASESLNPTTTTIMTLYYSLVCNPINLIDRGSAYGIQVFVLLVLEMALFVALIIPMPFAAKRKLFNFISESPIVAKIQYGMKVRDGLSPVCIRKLTVCQDHLHLHFDPVPRQRQ